MPLVKPMLAAKSREYDAEFQALLRYPIMASPKLDGIRATVQRGRLYSRSLKLIPNLAMQALWGCVELEGLDGEIICGPPTAEDVFNRTTSQVRRRDGGAEDAIFYVFDTVARDPNVQGLTFSFRHGYVMHKAAHTSRHQVKGVMHYAFKNWAQLAKYEAKQLSLGYEGIMLRDPRGLHKQGRSTLLEGGLIAIKRFEEAEGVVVDTYEQMENTNEQVVNELGRLKRSSHKAGRLGKDTLGGFYVELPNVPDGTDGRYLNIGCGLGLTDAIRKELWKNRKKLPGKIIKFKYQKIGTMVKPRQPIFLGFRETFDL